MKEKEIDYLIMVIENEGFGYTFFGYDGFAEIEDEMFHRFRKDLIVAKNNLRNYIVKQADIHSLDYDKDSFFGGIE